MDFKQGEMCMKKVIKNLAIGVLAVIIGGAVLLYGCTALFVNSVDQSIQETEESNKLLKDKAQEIVNNINWRREGDYLVGEFVNTTDKEIDYLEIEYKFIDSNGNVIDSSFVNESNIAPNETREIRIDTILANGYVSYELKVSEANNYNE